MPKLFVRFFIVIIIFIVASGCTNNLPIDEHNKPLINLLEPSLLYVKEGQIFVTDNNVTQEINISQNIYNNFSPLWFKEGESVLYIAENNNYFEIWKRIFSDNESQLLWGSKQKPKFISISPDRNWLIYAEADGCFLFNFENKKAQRFSDNCSETSWALKEKKFIYVDRGNLYLKEFNIKQELSDPVLLASGAIAGPVFLDKKTIIWEGVNANSDPATYDLFEFSLETKNVSPLTNLNFAKPGLVQIEIAEDGNKALYLRSDLSNAANGTLWLVNLAKPATAKKIIDNISQAVWDKSGNIVFSVSENNTNNIYQSSKDGLNKELILTNATAPIFYFNNISQK